MTQDASSLRDFVLNYCVAVGGLVEPPAYGIDDVLLPEDAANRWGVYPFQRLRFIAEPNASPPTPGVTFLYYGHPLVETMVAELRLRPANSRLFINPLRVEKPGLRELVDKLSFSNARPTARDVQRNRLYHYVCFNFKASLISDEKREMLVPLWMHLQGGYRVSAQVILASTSLDTEPVLSHLDVSPPFWRKSAAGEDALSPDTLSALLQRARLAILDEIAPTLDSARARSQRFLELDRARLEDYYEHLQQDLEKRLAKAEDERRSSLEAKLAAVQIERQSKLTDSEQKHQLRLDLELINLAVIAQPKIEIEVDIRRREVVTRRSTAWDPIRHILEPLVCDVCGRPGDSLALCESGHLAHAGCLTPQCVDCKRTFCNLCTEKVHGCVVCDKPVCVHSLVRCKTCGRETCQSHTDLCHAADGQPQKVSSAAPAPIQSHSSKFEEPKAPEIQPSKPSGKNGKTRTKVPSKKQAVPESQLKAVTAQRIQVEIETSAPVLRAFALRREREIAVRFWELGEDGIMVFCECEKGLACRANKIAHRPMDAAQIEEQLMRLISKFAEEYGVRDNKISFLKMAAGGVHDAKRLNLPAIWKDPQKLANAQAGFNKLMSR